METKKSKRRQMATLLCSLGAIVIGGVAADAWAQGVVKTNGRSCDAYIPDGDGGTTKITLVYCTGSTHVCECSAKIDGQGNIVSLHGACCPS